MRRFVMLAALLVGLLGSLEVLARRRGELMQAIAHRVHFKLALLEQKGSAGFVVLGSSRGNDCVAPGPIGWGGASVATPSSSLETLEAIAETTAKVPGLKVAFVELSRRQMAKDEADDAEAPSRGDDWRADPLGAWLSQHSALLRGRRALAIENWGRIPALLFPSQFDGSEFMHTRWLAEALVRVGPAAPDELAVLRASSEPPTAQAGPEWERVARGFRHVAEVFRAHGVKVLFYGTPLSKRRQHEECTAEARAFRASIAAFAEVPFEDFACVDVPPAWLTDGDEHCGALGRARFSERLGELAREHGLMNGVALGASLTKEVAPALP